MRTPAERQDAAPGPPPQAQPRLRADARRNREEIRSAALHVFRSHGLGTPLNEVARLAGVSKGTIYHRFGSRQALIDDVVEEILGERMRHMVAAIDTLSDPGERFVEFLRQILIIQYEEPAANDMLIRLLPESQKLVMMCDRTSGLGRQLLDEAQAAGVIRGDITPGDLDRLIWERSVILRYGARQERADYERHVDLLLHGLFR